MTRSDLQWRKDRVSQCATERGVTFVEALAWIDNTDEGRAYIARKLELLRRAVESDEISR
jgi:hypothetical protein